MTNHELTTGDLLHDTNEHTLIRVLAVGDDGSVTWVAEDDRGRKLHDTKTTMSAEDIQTGLDEGIIEIAED